MRAGAIWLILLWIPLFHEALRAAPEEASAGSPDEIVGRVGERVITRRDILSRLGLALEEAPQADEAGSREALTDQACLLVAVHLAEEDRLEVMDDLVASTATGQLELHARALADQTGKPCRADDVLVRMGWTREAWEDATRCMLLERAFLLYLAGGSHSFQNDWRPAVEPADVERYFLAQGGAYDVQHAARFIVFDVLLADHMEEGGTRLEAATRQSRMTGQLAELLRIGVEPAVAAQRVGLPPARMGAPAEGQYAEAGDILEHAGPQTSDWLLDPARRRGDVQVFSRTDDDVVLFFLESRPGMQVSLAEVRDRVEKDLRHARARHAGAALMLELAGEPGFITPPSLALAVTSRSVDTLKALAPFATGKPSEAPPLPCVVLESIDVALEEAAASDCLLYLHVDPIPDDAERVVTDATLERLATRYVVAVVSGRIGDRAADRLRLRYGLMRPGAMSVAIAPSGTLVDADVPFEADGAWAAMQAAERATVSAAPRGPATLCSAVQDEPPFVLSFDPPLASVNEPLSVRVWATNDTQGAIPQLRVTMLLQGADGAPRLTVLTLGLPNIEPGYFEEARHDLRPRAAGWLRALAIVEGGPELRRGARARVYVR